MHYTGRVFLEQAMIMFFLRCSSDILGCDPAIFFVFGGTSRYLFDRLNHQPIRLHDRCSLP